MFSAKGRGLIMLAVASATMMNVAMKSLTGYSGYWVYVVAIAVGLLLSVIGFFAFEHGQRSVIRFDWWMVVLGVAVAVLNFAYLWIYQEGGSVAYIPLIVTALLTVVLSIVGVVYFGENISLQQYIGIAIVLIGLGVVVL